MKVKKSLILVGIYMVIAMLLLITAASLQATPALLTEQEKEDYLIGFYGEPNLDLITQNSGEVNREFNLVKLIAAKLPQDAIDALSKNPHIRFIEPDSEVRSIAQSLPWGIDRVFGPDEYSFSTWQLPVQHSITVAVLDTGIDRHHVDLPTLLGGVNTIDSTDWGFDGYGHGTHVAGTIAALDNNIGVVGITPGIGIYSVKVMNDNGSGTISSVIAGLEWAVNNNVSIINMSLAASTYSLALKEACDAVYANGILMIAAAGNSGSSAIDNVQYPARYPTVIAVSASNSSNRIANFSSVGPSIELIAPGVSIRSTIPGDTYSSLNGTSMAAPHVAGSAALTWSVNSSLTNVDVREILKQTAQNLNLPDEHQGHGLVRVDLSAAEAASLIREEEFIVNVNLFWQNISTGELLVWEMDDNFNRIGRHNLNPSSVNPSWRVAATHDLTGDGSPELIWQNISTGELLVWEMDGFTSIDRYNLSPASVHPSWRIAAVSDLTVDGSPEIIWHNHNTGELLVWEMDGFNRIGRHNLSPASVYPSWRIAATCDLNGDGSPEVVWQNISTGEFLVWEMDGFNRIGRYNLNPSPVNQSWRILGNSY